MQTTTALSKGEFRRAISAALNRTARAARTAAAKQIRETYTAARLTRFIKVENSTARTLEARLIIRATPMPLSLFSAKQEGPGVTYQLKRSGPRRLIKGAFLSTFLSRKTALAIKRRVGRREGRPRLPITQLAGISPAQMFKDVGAPAVEAVIRETFPKRLRAEITHRTAKMISSGAIKSAISARAGRGGG